MTVVSVIKCQYKNLNILHLDQPYRPSYFLKPDHTIAIINWTISDDKYLFYMSLEGSYPVSYQELT